MKKPRKIKYLPVHIKTDPRNNMIILNRELRYKDVTVPRLYKSDGMSKLINKFPPDCIRASIFHDYCCDTNCISRKRADRYFYELLRLDGVSWFRARRYYYAVRLYATVTLKG